MLASAALGDLKKWVERVQASDSVLPAAPAVLHHASAFFELCPA
jgi:hypothetical protein